MKGRCCSARRSSILTTPSHHRLYLRALCQLHRDDSLQRRLLPPLPRVAPLKIARLPLSVLSRALAASEPSFNGSGLDAPFAERTLPAACRCRPSSAARSTWR